jgi:hypothetical protein
MKAGVLVHEAPAECANLGPLPVRVRKSTGEIVGSGVTGAPIEVPVGSYYVTVVMPDGREIGTKRKVRSTVPALAGSAAPPPPPIVPPAAEIARPLPPPVPALSQTARLWEGDWLGELARGLSSDDASLIPELPLSSTAPAIIPHEGGCDRLLILRLSDRFRCTIIPYDECLVCLDEAANPPAISAILSESPDGLVIDYRSTVSDETNGLLGFVESGVLTNMVTVTEDQIRRGEQALAGKGASVLRAITGAYILLRANTLDGVEAWLDRLEPMATNLPDLLPLRMELSARKGDHGEAVNRMVALLDSGRCPWFRAGLSYTLERLRLYIDVTDNRHAVFNLSRGDYLSFRAARDGLERLLPMMLTSRYIATFDLPLAKAAS